MVEPQIIGSNRTGESKSPAERRSDAKVQIPQSDDVRIVETYDALPVLNKREPIITSENSSFKYLRLARIVLDPDKDGYAPQEVKTSNEELILYVNRGAATVTINGESQKLNTGDVAYVGINTTAIVTSDSFTDVSEYRAVDCNTSYPVQYIKHKELEKTELTPRPPNRLDLSFPKMVKKVRSDDFLIS